MSDLKKDMVEFDKDVYKRKLLHEMEKLCHLRCVLELEANYKTNPVLQEVDEYLTELSNRLSYKLHKLNAKDSL